MIRTLFLTLCMIFSPILAYSISENDIIIDQAESLRCKKLLQERDEKILYKQNLTSLLKKAQKLEKMTPEAKRTVKTNLRISSTEIKNNLRLTNLRIQNMEENIVRKGCPGVKL